MTLRVIKSYLDIPLDDLSAHQDTPLWQINPRQRHKGLSNDLITREPIEAQHHEVKGQLRHSSQRDPIETEGLIKRRIKSLPEDSGLHTVLFLWQQGQLDVGVRGEWLLISWGQTMGFLDQMKKSNESSRDDFEKTFPFHVKTANTFDTLIWTMNAFFSGWYSREKWRVPRPASFSSPWSLSTAGVGAWLERVLDGEGRSRRSITPGWVNPAWGEGSSRSGELRTFWWWWWKGLVVKLPLRSRFSRSKWRAGLEPFGLETSLLVPDGLIGAVWQFPLTSVLLVSVVVGVAGAANFFLPLRLSG